MLDPRVREILLAIQGERITVEQAAQSLLDVRRETGCMTLMVSAHSSTAERALVERYATLARDEFGDA